MPSGWPENDGVALNPNSPKGLGICDFCGRSYHLDDLRWQYQWGGDRLINQGLRVCSSCLDEPQIQLRSIILPGDPKPLKDPRPPTFTVPGSAEYLQWSTNLNGFVQNTLTTYPIVLTKAAVLTAAEATPSGVPAPTVVDRSGTMTAANVVQQIIAANATRTYLIVYNPTVTDLAISLGSPNFNSPSTVVCGFGTALIQNANTLQPPAVMWTGAVFAKSVGSNVPFYAWESA